MQAKREVVQKLDNEDYLPEETITLKFPMSLPYPIHTDNYHRVNGEFEYNGQHYKLVKQKLEADTLYIVCYKDNSVKRIDNAFADFARFSNDLPLSGKNSLTFMGKMMKDYESVHHPGVMHHEGWSYVLFVCDFTPALLNQCSTLLTPPPQVVV